MSGFAMESSRLLTDEAAKQETRNYGNPDCLQRVGRNVTARIRNQLLLRGV